MPAMGSVQPRSPRRGEAFVTRKITRGLARINGGLDSCLYMETLMPYDWGHARLCGDAVAHASAGDSA